MGKGHNNRAVTKLIEERIETTSPALFFYYTTIKVLTTWHDVGTWSYFLEM